MSTLAGGGAYCCCGGGLGLVAAPRLPHSRSLILCWAVKLPPVAAPGAPGSSGNNWGLEATLAALVFRPIDGRFCGSAGASQMSLRDVPDWWLAAAGAALRPYVLRRDVAGELERVFGGGGSQVGYGRPCGICSA
jgi:hypothetical protein